MSHIRGLGDEFRGVTPEELPPPIAPLVASMGSLRVRRCMPVGGKEGEGEGVGVLPGGESTPKDPFYSS